MVAMMSRAGESHSGIGFESQVSRERERKRERQRKEREEAESDPMFPKKKEKRQLPFDEVLCSGLGSYRKTAEDYEKVGIRAAGNSAEDIMDLTREFMARLEGGPPSVDPAIEKLRCSFTERCLEDGLSWTRPAMIGASFVAKHRDLFAVPVSTGTVSADDGTR